MKKIHLLSASLLLLAQVYAQDQILVNPAQALMQVNPSYAGSNGSIRDQFVYRNLWPSLGGSYIMFYNGLDAYVKPLHGGVGISFMSESQAHGTYKSSQFNFVYAPSFTCKNTGLRIIPSVQVSYLQRSVDLSNVTFGQGVVQWVPGAAPQSQKKGMDFSGGLLFNYKNFYAGGSVFHINQPDIGTMGESRLPRRISFNAAYNLPLNEKTLLNFSAIVHNQQTYTGYQLAVNAIFLSHIITSLGYMNDESVFMQLGYRSNHFSVTGGYDMSFSKLSGNTAGSWQLGLGFSMRKKEAGQLPAAFENW